MEGKGTKNICWILTRKERGKRGKKEENDGSGENLSIK